MVRQVSKPSIPGITRSRRYASGKKVVCAASAVARRKNFMTHQSQHVTEYVRTLRQIVPNHQLSVPATTR